MENKEKKKAIDLSNPLTVNGSLGLLAVGYKGLLAWREVKKQAQQNNPQKKP